MAKMVNEATGLAAVDTKTPGKYKIRLIDAGVGSSGVYPATTLEQAARDRIFPRGTRVHLDHPFKASEMSGPRSVKDWCAVFTEDAEYNGDQESLEAEIKVFKPYQELIGEMKDEVGMSIIAFAETSPSSVPGGMPNVDRLTQGLSVDFVTQAGRGGKILQVLEAAGMVAKEATDNDRRKQLTTALRDKYQNDDNYVWVADFDEEQHLVWFSTDGPRMWEQGYSVADDDLTVSLDGDAVEVRTVTQYVRVNPEPDTQTQDQTEGAVMDAETQAKLDQLAAENARLAKENADMKAAQLTKDNTDKATGLIDAAESIKPLPVAAQARVKATVLASLPVDEAGALNETALATMVDESAKTEAEYLEAAKGITPPQLESAQVNGFGESMPVTEAGTTPARTRNPWGRDISTMKG